MAVTVTKLDAPTDVSAALQDGGNLLPNTTYYVVVTAKNYIGQMENHALFGGRLQSNESDEISFTTTSTKKSALITWTRPTGGAAYNVYISKTSGDYGDLKSGANYVAAGHRCGRTGNNAASQTQDTVISNLDNFLISEEGTINTAYIGELIGWSSVYDTYNPNKIMGVFPITGNKKNGMISVSFTGSNTLKTICDELTSQGYGDYFYYNNSNLFMLRGSFYIPSSQSTPGYLSITRHTVYIIGGVMQVSNANSYIQFGSISGNRAYNGCIVVMSSLDLTNIKAYNTSFLPNLFPTYEYYVNSNAYNSFVSIGNNAINCTFGEYSIIPNDLVGQNFFAASSSSLYTRTGWENDNIQIYQFFTNDGMGNYRDCVINIAASNFICHLYNYTTYYNDYFNDIRFIDCLFGGSWNNDYSLHKYKFGLATNSGGVSYYNSIKLKVIDKNAEIISGASVTLKDKYENVVLSGMTDEDGEIDKTDILVYQMIQKNGQTGLDACDRYDYNPFTLTISKDGYDDYVLVFTHNVKLDTNISLGEKDPIIYYNQELKGVINTSTIQGSIVSTSLSGDIY